MEIISCKSLGFKYATSEYPSLNDVNFDVLEGELCLVIGKSGAGKSTILKLLKKEIAPAGELTGEFSVNAPVGFVPQNVEENIVCDKVRSELSFGLVNLGYSREMIDLKVSEIASYFNLSHKLDEDVSNLSGGEKQILNLASVMITNPKVIVLDEPTSKLDPVSARRFILTIKKLHSDFGITVVIAEHLLEEIYPYADKVVLVENGTVLKVSNPFEMVDYLKETKNEMLKSIPISLRLFSGAKTVADCRKVLCSKELSPFVSNYQKGETALKIKNVFFAYKKNNDVLKDLSLQVEQGKINSVLGANGSGKTTLLKVACGVLKAHHGKIKANGRVAMLCQNPFDLFTKEKCYDEVEFGEITSFLEIDDIKNQHPYDLSNGQAQRLALAKVLETGADIILLDEPTKALDSAFKSKLGDKLRELCKMGKTILLVSHDTDFVAEFSDAVSFLSNGEIVTTLPRQEMFANLDFYTSSVSKITKGICDEVVSFSDLEKCGGLNE